MEFGQQTIVYFYTYSFCTITFHKKYSDDPVKYNCHIYFKNR